MSQSKSPNYVYPTFPQLLWVDGEAVNEDTLCVSATANRGTLGKLIDAVGYLRKRTPQIFVITTDGIGGATITTATPQDDNATAFFSSAVVFGNFVRLTFTTAFSSIAEYSVFVQHEANEDDQVGQIWGRTTTRFDVGAYDISSGFNQDPATTAHTWHVLVFDRKAL